MVSLAAESAAWWETTAHLAIQATMVLEEGMEVTAAKAVLVEREVTVAMEPEVLVECDFMAVIEEGSRR